MKARAAIIFKNVYTKDRYSINNVDNATSDSRVHTYNQECIPPGLVVMPGDCRYSAHAQRVK